MHHLVAIGCGLYKETINLKVVFMQSNMGRQILSVNHSYNPPKDSLSDITFIDESLEKELEPVEREVAPEGYYIVLHYS